MYSWFYPNKKATTISLKPFCFMSNSYILSFFICFRFRLRVCVCVPNLDIANLNEFRLSNSKCA